MKGANDANQTELTRRNLLFDERDILRYILYTRSILQTYNRRNEWHYGRDAGLCRADARVAISPLAGGGTDAD
jgi:hypothetical protein